MKKTILVVLFVTMAADAISQKEICLPAVFKQSNPNEYFIHQDCKDPEGSFLEFLQKMNINKSFEFRKEGTWYIFTLH